MSSLFAYKEFISSLVYLLSKDYHVNCWLVLSESHSGVDWRPRTQVLLSPSMVNKKTQSLLLWSLQSIEGDSYINKWKLCRLFSHSVMSDLSATRGLQPSRLLCPWGFQAGIPEWVVIPFSRGSPRPRGGTRASCIAGFLSEILYCLSNQVKIICMMNFKRHL